MPDPVEINAQDMIEALVEQRNDALNKLAQATAALRLLQRKHAPPEATHADSI